MSISQRLVVRINREMENLEREGKDIFSLGINVNDEIRDREFNFETKTLHGRLKGPLGTPYEYGLFPFEMTIPDDYPFSPPTFKFLEPIPFHPNVYTGHSRGKVCITILEKGEQKDNWSPIHSFESIIRSIQSLLADYREGSMANQDAGHLSRENLDAFKEKAHSTMVQNGQYFPPQARAAAALGVAAAVSGLPAAPRGKGVIDLNVSVKSND